MSQQLPKIKLLETIVDVSDTQMPAEGDTVTCRYVAMARNSRRHLYPSYNDDAIRNPKEGVILDSGRSCTWTVGSGEVSARVRSRVTPLRLSPRTAARSPVAAACLLATRSSEGWTQRCSR